VARTVGGIYKNRRRRKRVHEPWKNAGRKKRGRREHLRCARESGVSVFTVSAVVNNKSHVGKGLRERVEAAIRKLNYRPNLIARSLAKQRTHTIGMLCRILAPVFSVGGCGRKMRTQKQGYNLLLCNSDDSLDKKRSYRVLCRSAGRNFVDEGSGRFPAAARQMIKEVDIPFVLSMRTYRS